MRRGGSCDPEEPLPSERVERRLAAVVAAEVADYARLMRADAERARADLKRLQRTLIGPAVATHRGRVVKTSGDEMLVEFPSAVDAARCAIEVQRSMAEQNAALPQDVRIEFRIGIHLGDIMIEADDIFGDGVNTPARLHQIPEPGAISISAHTHPQIPAQPHLPSTTLHPPPL